MFKKFLFSLGAAFLLALAAPASAQTGDLFADKHWSPYGRPWVPSDLMRSSDMFPAIPTFYNTNADLFGHARPNFNFGRSDMFVQKPPDKPYYPLFNYPEK